MFLRESILRKSAGEKEVNAVLKKYRDNNPDHAQYMTDDNVISYVKHKQQVQDLDRQIASLRRAQKGQGLGKMVNGSYEKGSVGDRLMKANRARAANKAYMAKFEKERGLRRDTKLDEKQLDTYRANMQKMQNIYANELTKNLPKEYFEEGKVMDKQVFDEASAKALETANNYAKSQFGLFDDAKAAQWDAYSKYLSGGGKESGIQYTGPGIDTKMKVLALNAGIDPNFAENDDGRQEAQERRALWEQGKKLQDSGQFGGVKDRSHSDYADREKYAWADLIDTTGWDIYAKPFVSDEKWDKYKKAGGFKGMLKARDEGKIKWQQRHNLAGQKQKEFAKQQFAKSTADTSTQYAQGRRDKITGYLKDNWMPIAGLGLGALGLLGMAGMYHRRQQQPAMQMQQAPGARQTPQQGVDEWAKNYNFRRGPAGTQQETVLGAQKPGGFNFSSIYNKFMGGARG
jgi:hypothetical protein